MESKHISVLLKESIETLDIVPGKCMVDCTLGGGGYSIEILKKLNQGTLILFDVDNQAITRFLDYLLYERFEVGEFSGEIVSCKRGGLEIILINDNFQHIQKYLNKLEIKRVDGIVADLGFSTDQLDENLSFQKSGELDLRMDKNLQVKASDLVNGMYEKELESLFEKYSDEKSSKQIAKEIVKYRKEKLINTKEELVSVISNVASKRHDDSKKVCQRIFQALRIAVNGELHVLNKMLCDSFSLLEKDGRLVIVSFHSGEDREVKHFMMDKVKSGEADWLVKMVKPDHAETKLNPKSDSAKLRAIKKN